MKPTLDERYAEELDKAIYLALNMINNAEPPRHAGLHRWEIECIERAIIRSREYIRTTVRMYEGDEVPRDLGIPDRAVLPGLCPEAMYLAYVVMRILSRPGKVFLDEVEVALRAIAWDCKLGRPVRPVR